MSRAALTLARAYIVNIIPTLPHHTEQHAQVIAVLDAALAEAQPLTREQIAAAVRPLYQTDQIAEASMVYDEEIARAIERAHGITTTCPQCGTVDGHKLQCGERTDGQIKLNATEQQ